MRAVSIRVDDSTLTTVAPKSASARPTNGPATTQLKSATFRPAIGSSVMTRTVGGRVDQRAIVAEPLTDDLRGVLAQQRRRPAQPGEWPPTRRPPGQPR